MIAREGREEMKIFDELPERLRRAITATDACLDPDRYLALLRTGMPVPAIERVIANEARMALQTERAFQRDVILELASGE